MEPVHPELRAALKETHPQLTDADINRLEELTALRMMIDPQQEPERIAEIDRERQLLIEQKMPSYAEVARMVSARQAERAPKAPQQKVTVQWKLPK